MDENPEIIVDEHHDEKDDEDPHALSFDESSSSDEEKDSDLEEAQEKKSLAIPLSEVKSDGGGSFSTSSVSASDFDLKTLHQIARDGDVSFLRDLRPDRLRDLSGHVNDLDDRHLSPAHYAARYSHVDMLAFLVDMGADVNKRGEDDMTPLHYAARYSKKASSQALKALRQMQRSSSMASVAGLGGPDDGKAVASSPNNPNSPSSRRSSNGSASPDRRGSDPSLADLDASGPAAEAVIMLLIEKGADVNARDKYKLSALHHAAMRGHVVAVNRLMQTPGIDKEPRDGQGSTPLHLAATYNHRRAASALLEEGANPRSQDSSMRTPVHEACLEGNQEIVELLLEKARETFGETYATAMLRDKDSEGCTPLLLGVGSGCASVVRLLVTRGAGANTANNALVTPAHSAARTGDIESLKVLVEYRARLDARNALQQTPLFLAAQNNHSKVISYLAKGGANLNLCDLDGLSPILAASKEGHEECVSVLMSLGARLDVVDKNEKSAMFHAAEQDHSGVLKTLLSRFRGRELLVVKDQCDNLPLHIACAGGHLECAKMLIDAGAEIDNKNEDEQTPLHLAAINGRTRVVRFILKTDPNAVMNADEDSNTALHLACTWKRAKVVEVLLNAGADVQSKNAKKWTPLDCAAAAGAYSCAKLLLDNDAPIDSLDRSKTTPLHLAAENGHEKMILLLLNRGANIASEDALGRNMLELAILCRKKHVAKAVLQHKDWRKALRSTCTVTDSKGALVPNTPLRLLIRIYPDLAEMVFEQCVTVERSKDEDHLPTSTLIWQEGANVKFDYEFLDDSFNLERRKEVDQGQETIRFAYCPVGSQNVLKPFSTPYDRNQKVVMDNHPLMIMAHQKQKNLLRHPLCLALVRQKWKAFGRYVYYGTLAFYALFLVFLTAYILVAPNPSQYVQLNTCGNSSPTSYFSVQRELIANGSKPKVDLPSRDTIERVSQVGVMVLVFILLALELVQWFRAGRRYFRLHNLFDWVVCVLSFVLVYDIENNSVYTGLRTCWQWELGSIVIVIAWLNLLGDIRQLPYLGIYVIMFFDVLKTFLKFMIVFFVVLIGFALGFHTLLISTEDSPFNDYGYSLLKTSVMMLGEFEFDALFFNGKNLPFESSTVILFIIFVVIMAIIVMNLLIGLAVDDIKAVQEQAVLKRLAMQVELILDVERILPVLVLRRTHKQTEVMSRSVRPWWSFFTDVVSSKSIVRDVTSVRTEIGLEDIVDRQTSLDDSLKQLKSDVRSMVSENEKLKEMLMAIVEHNNISVPGMEEF